MTLITPNPPAEISPNTWRFTWSDVGGPYHVWHRGRRVTRVNAPRFDVFEPDPAIVPMVEVATSLDDQPQQRRNPERMVIQWRAPEDAPAVQHYRIEALVGGEWALEDIVLPRPRRYHLWTSQRLDDDVMAVRRVVPVIAGGHRLPGVRFAVRIVRMPDVPRTSVTYSSQTATITIDAA